MYVAILVYLFAAALVGLLGRDTAAGFMGMFLVSIIISPVIALVCLYLMRPNKRERLLIARAKLDEEVLRVSRRRPAKST